VNGLEDRAHPPLTEAAGDAVLPTDDLPLEHCLQRYTRAFVPSSKRRFGRPATEENTRGARVGCCRCTWSVFAACASSRHEALVSPAPRPRVASCVPRAKARKRPR
jgi:hypothetical protein